MTDKQIIIDGVDVNDCHNRTFYKNDEGDVQCKCYRFEGADSDTLLFGICKQHPYCYYKQLKRKEQECEELKENLPNAITRLMGELDQLKAENEGLKEFYNEWNPQIPTIVNTIGNANLTIKAWVEESNRLKQTLTEIKDYCNKYPQNSIGFKQQILQKISEVENEKI